LCREGPERPLRRGRRCLPPRAAPDRRAFPERAARDLGAGLQDSRRGRDSPEGLMFGTVPEAAVWAIFLAPVASLVVLAVGFPRSNARVTGYVGIAAVAVSFILSLWLF